MSTVSQWASACCSGETHMNTDASPCSKCGSTVRQLAPGKTHHLASLVCGNGHWLKWLSKHDLAKSTEVTSVTQALLAGCDIQHYGAYSGYYVSLTFACSGGLAQEMFYDYLT